MNAPAKIETSAPVAPVAKIAGIEEAAKALAGGLAGNSVSVASATFYRAALAEAKIDVASLGFDEIVEVTRRLYALSADYRRSEATVAKAEKAKLAEAAKAKRDAERAKRIAAEIDAAEAKLRKLRGETA